MQTLLDPFELAAPPPFPPIAMARPPVASASIEIDVEVLEPVEEAVAPSKPLPPSPDSRLRCWCSED